jgi:hypothetical protein
VKVLVVFEVGKRKMVSAGEMQEGRRGEQALPTTRREGDFQAAGMRSEDGGVRQVLEPDRIPRTLVIIVYEEGVNHFPGMAYYGGVFSGREVGIQALDFILEYPYPMRATIDISRQWSIRGFSRFSIVHLVWIVVRQWMGF